MAIQSDLNELNDLLLRVQGHALCAKLEENPPCYLVHYPPGSSVNGVMISYHGIGKIQALTFLLSMMEKEWQDRRCPF